MPLNGIPPPRPGNLPGIPNRVSGECDGDS